MSEVPPPPEVTLRPATMDDAAQLLSWRNDPQTRAMSISEGHVAREDHLRWLRARLLDPSSRVYVAVDPGRSVPVGVGRLDALDGGRVALSLTVDPEQRGRGYAARIIEQLIARALAGELGPYPVLVAQVRDVNHASLRAFTAAGFRPSRHDDHGLLTLERLR